MRVFSQFSYAMYLISLPLYILHITNSLAESGLFFAIISIPSIIITPFIGTYIDRIDRKKIILIVLIIITILYYLLYILQLYKQIIYLFIISVIIKVLNEMFDITTKVIFTELVEKDDIEKANGVKSMLDNSATIIAPVIGTFIFGYLGFSKVILFCTILYMLAYLFCLKIQYKSKMISSSYEQDNGYWMQLKNGIFYIYHQKYILGLFILVMTLNFLIANADEIIYPGIIIQKYHISDSLYGFSSTLTVLGTIVASAWIFKNKKINLHKQLYRLFIIASSLMIIVGVLAIVIDMRYANSYFILFLILQFIIGFVVTCINIPLWTYFQRNVSLEYQRRFFSLLSFSANLLIPLGIIYAGFLSEHMGADITFIINNALIIGIVLLIKNKVGRKYNEH
ncbi:MAG: MFS transporter [Coprobacillaceae bacterium]